MNFKHVWTIFKKEVKDIIRDKKTIITSLLVPIVLFPVLFAIMGGGFKSFEKGMNENITIALAKESNTAETKNLLKEKVFKDYSNVSIVDIEDAVKSIREEKVRVILDFEKGYAGKLKEGKPFKIKAMYDKSKAKSERALSVINEAFGKYNTTVVSERLAAIGLNPEILQPTVVEGENVADKRQGGNMMTLMMLPMLIGMLVASGGIPAATDLVAGEKERNTLEPLLTTRPSRSSILLAKYFTVTLFSMVSVIATLTGMVLGFLMNSDFMNMGGGSEVTGFYVPPMAVVLTLLTTIALGMTFAGIQIALSAYAKSFKEAQTYLSFLIFIAMIPSYATMMMQPSDIPSFMFFVPVLNVISASKMVLGGIINYSNLGIALLSSIVYVAISLYLAAWMFKREKILFRS
jgi:sodium transport system permease protein